MKTRVYKVNWLFAQVFFASEILELLLCGDFSEMSDAMLNFPLLLGLNVVFTVHDADDRRFISFLPHFLEALTIWFFHKCFLFLAGLFCS